MMTWKRATNYVTGPPLHGCPQRIWRCQALLWCKCRLSSLPFFSSGPDKEGNVHAHVSRRATFCCSQCQRLLLLRGGRWQNTKLRCACDSRFPKKIFT